MREFSARLRKAVHASGSARSTRQPPGFGGCAKEASAMLTALILICSTAITPELEDCTLRNAITVMRLPVEFANPDDLLHARFGLLG